MTQEIRFEERHLDVGDGELQGKPAYCYLDSDGSGTVGWDDASVGSDEFDVGGLLTVVVPILHYCQEQGTESTHVNQELAAR